MSMPRGMLGIAAVLALFAWASHPGSPRRTLGDASPCVDPYGQPCQKGTPPPPPPPSSTRS